jgi:hypothetical protein
MIIRKKVLKDRLKHDEYFGQTINQIRIFFDEDKENGEIPQNMTWKHYLRQHKQVMREQIKEELQEIEK